METVSGSLWGTSTLLDREGTKEKGGAQAQAGAVLGWDCSIFCSSQLMGLESGKFKLVLAAAGHWVEGSTRGTSPEGHRMLVRDGCSESSSLWSHLSEYIHPLTRAELSGLNHPKP